MVRRVAPFAMIVVAAVACSEDRSDRGEAAAFQLRPVIEIVSGPSPRPYVPVTCDAEGREASDCLAAHARESVVVREPTSMDTYQLGPVVVDDGDIADATAQEAGGGWSVAIALTSDGSDALASATTAAVGDRIAIVVDGRVVSAPTVQEPITSGMIVVAGDLSEAEANALAARLGEG